MVRSYHHKQIGNAAAKIRYSSSPQEKKTWNQAIHSPKAMNIMDDVSLARASMERLDEGKFDKADGQGQVSIDAPGFKPDFVSRNLTTVFHQGGAMSTLATEFPYQENAVERAIHNVGTSIFGGEKLTSNPKVAEGGDVKGSLVKTDDGRVQMNVTVARDGEEPYVVSQSEKKDGSKVLRSGNDVLTINPNGTIAMGTHEI